jgi:hypothetical protein
MVRYGVWLAIAARSLGSHRFQVNVITRILGAYALVSVIKNNEKRPVRRTVDWYKRLGDPREVKNEVENEVKNLRRARQALKSAER